MLVPSVFWLCTYSYRRHLFFLKGESYQVIKPPTRVDTKIPHLKYTQELTSFGYLPVLVVLADGSVSSGTKLPESSLYATDDQRPIRDVQLSGLTAVITAFPLLVSSSTDLINHSGDPSLDLVDFPTLSTHVGPRYFFLFPLS